MAETTDKIRIYFPPVEGGNGMIDIARVLGVGGAEPPRWGDGPDQEKYREFNARAKDYFESVSLENAQLMIYPFPAEDVPAVHEISRLAGERELECLFFNWGDADVPLKV